VREAYWPPTDDLRCLALVRYTARAESDDKPADRGVGMVGSVTFCLFGKATWDMPPEDVYAPHCAWELRKKDDPRAPEKLELASARALWKKLSRR
jgi:hypothetical protein